MKYIETSEHKVSMFRIWLTKTWPQHCNETLSFDGKPVGYSMDDWIKKNKWFLKRQYQNVVKKVRNTGKHA